MARAVDYYRRLADDLTYAAEIRRLRWIGRMLGDLWRAVAARRARP